MEQIMIEDIGYRIKKLIRESSESTYYISTGDLSGFYTLRVRFPETRYRKDEFGRVGDSYVVERDYFICNLSTDREKAIQKAFEKTGKRLNINFDLQDIKRGRENSIDWSIFQAGKYKGFSIVEVLERDKQYVIWACENLSKTRGYEKTIELARAYIEHELHDREVERELQKFETDQRKQRVIQALSSVANELEDGEGGFRDSIASDLRRGELPRGRGLSITIDILSKLRGRRNSKSYEQRYTELSDLFASLEE